MRELLKAAETVVDEYKGFASPHFHSLLVKLEEAIAAAKERSKWVKVADGLPVVPEGQYVARFWIYDKYGHVSKLRLFAHDSKEHIEQACQSVTHYMPRQDDTPAPPEAS